MKREIIHKIKSFFKTKIIDIVTFLSKMGNHSNLTFDKFLEHFDLYNETNMLVFIDQLKMLQMFLERSLNIMQTKKIQHKNFTHLICKYWYLIFHPYVIATYCTSYMNKLEKPTTLELKILAINVYVKNLMQIQEFKN